MSKVIDLSAYQTKDRWEKGKKVESDQCAKPKGWMLTSPAAFEQVSGIKISEEELVGVREAIYRMCEG